MYEKIICFFSSSFIKRNVCKDKVREAHSHGSDSVVFMWNLFAFLLRSPWVEIFPCLYFFLVVTPPTDTLQVDTPPSSMSLTQFMRHFLRSLQFPCSCILFTLGNRCTSCCFSTYSPTLLVCQTSNLRGISTGASASCLL